MNSNNLSKKPKEAIPEVKCPFNTIKLLSEGYLFIPNRVRKYNSPVFLTRLMGKKVVCMSGKKPAEVFYDQNLFTRKGAVPKRIQQTLFGKNAIQTLDGAAHIHRKLMFMSILAPKQLKRLIAITQKQWQMSSKSWEKRNQLVLFDEVSMLLFQSACKWAGVPLNKKEARLKSRDMSAMIDALGAVGPRHWRGRLARNKSERWTRTIISDVRSGRLKVPKNTALYTIAWHKNLDNRLMSTATAAVELINILRPITAIATYIVFGALALHTYPVYWNKYRTGDDAYHTMFVQEVRRFYPFGPFLGARARIDFTWYKHNFKKGDLVFLSIFGTNHDKGIWNDPESFRPERFAGCDLSPYDFIPQGGGDYKLGTRCPGEMLTIELMKLSLDYLVTKLSYKVPLQDLSYSLKRMPTLPKSKFIITNVKGVSKNCDYQI